MSVMIEFSYLLQQGHFFCSDAILADAKRLQNAEAEVLSSNKIKQNNKIPHERVIERCEMVFGEK